jgi:hypothetical protein
VGLSNPDRRYSRAIPCQNALDWRRELRLNEPLWASTDTLGGVVPNPTILAGGGRAVQWGKPLKASGLSLRQVANPRLLARCQRRL